MQSEQNSSVLQDAVQLLEQLSHFPDNEVNKNLQHLVILGTQNRFGRVHLLEGHIEVPHLQLSFKLNDLFENRIPDVETRVNVLGFLNDPDSDSTKLAEQTQSLFLSDNTLLQPHLAKESAPFLSALKGEQSESSHSELCHFLRGNEYLLDFPPPTRTGHRLYFT